MHHVFGSSGTGTLGRALELSILLQLVVPTELAVLVCAEDLHLASFSSYTSIGWVYVIALLQEMLQSLIIWLLDCAELLASRSEHFEVLPRRSMRELIARGRSSSYHVWKTSGSATTDVRASLFMHRRNTSIWICNLRWRGWLALSQMARIVRECQPAAHGQTRDIPSRFGYYVLSYQLEIFLELSPWNELLLLLLSNGWETFSFFVEWLLLYDVGCSNHISQTATQII